MTISLDICRQKWYTYNTSMKTTSNNLPEIRKINVLSETEKKALVLEALLKAGFNQYQSSQLMDVSRQHISTINKKIKKGTLNPLVTKAKKAVKLILEGKSVGGVRDVKASDVLTAAKMVLDRSDPVTTKVESTHVNVNYDLKEEDRSRYKRALGIIDAEYEVLPEPPRQIEDKTDHGIPRLDEKDENWAGQTEEGREANV